MSVDDLFEAWRTNNAANLRLLSRCPDESLDWKGEREESVRSNWVQIVLIRRKWLEELLGSLVGEIPKLDGEKANREEIASALTVSFVLISQVVENLTIKPIRWSAAKYLAYSIAHEAHHRSVIEKLLRQHGVEVESGESGSLWV